MLLCALCPASVTSAAETRPQRPKDPLKSLYQNYKPDFLAHIYGRRGALRGWRMPEKRMRLSTEKGFYTLTVLEQDARADALVTAALNKESQSQYRDALKMYQLIVRKYPECLYRVSKYGIFVPVSEYCQRRVLGFPPEHLAHYRTLYDPRAKEAFDQARRKNSLIGLSDVVNTMLATSYGGKAILELGNASLDTGYYLAALERFGTIRDFFPYPELRTPELNLKIAYCRTMLGLGPKKLREPGAESGLLKDQLRLLDRVLKTAKHEKVPFHSQLASAPHAAADDYTLMPPPTDPMALVDPTWQHTLAGSRRDYFVFTQPVVTPDSVIYRHKNIVYCRSVLNGEPRWVNNLGGRAVWQNASQHQFPQEDVLVQDGLVFTVISKGGPSLVALDQVTGQLRWAYGPMVASTVEEARMRFEAAPAGGPRAIYAGYVLDNIEGATHTDTEYGLIAFESTTGRIRWRRSLCRLMPGKFAAGFAIRRRNRIRSFTSPPLHHQGTIYYTTNAGAIAALDALSGRVKWLFRYPYHPPIHDATRTFQGAAALLPGSRGWRLWYNQRPLIVGERLYLTPVDSAMLFCVDRRTGRILWTKPHSGRDARYFLGPISTGELVMVYSGRARRIAWYGDRSTNPIHLLDPATGRTVWTSPDLVMDDPHPVMRHYIYGTCASADINRRWVEVAARPLLTSDDRIYVSTVGMNGAYYRYSGRFYNLTAVSLRERKIIAKRRYYDGTCMAMAARNIQSSAPADYKTISSLPHHDAQARHRMKVMKEISEDTQPVNKHGPFMPFSRITFSRYGVPFELRFGPRRMGMVYKRGAVLKALRNRRDTAADFARAELKIAESEFSGAAVLLKRCLKTISSEDLDFRALINQQLYRVHKRLCRSAIRARQPDKELVHALGMTRTAGTLADEIETLFALSEVYERKGDLAAAVRCLRSIVATYGHHEYPVPAAAVSNPTQLLAAAHGVLDRATGYAKNPLYGGGFQKSLQLLRKGLPLYLSTVSPLPKTLTVRAGELAATRLARLQRVSPEFAARLERTAVSELKGRTEEEQLYRLWEFPGTATAQEVITELFQKTGARKGETARHTLWRLADAARICGLEVPQAHRARVTAPPTAHRAVRIDLPARVRPHDLAEAEGINWLVLERRGDRSSHPNLLLLGGRVRKRLDNKFILACFDLSTGRLIWQRQNIRLKGTGQEPGFFEAFVCGDALVVHGLYDVLAFDVRTGRPRWRYRVPFDFEIKCTVMSGDLLVLGGETESIALYLPTSAPAGEVVWQVTERGDLYMPSYFAGASGGPADRLVSVRRMPFNVTVRYRATGKLIGRLDVPDLSLFTKHPLLQGGPRAVAVARDGKQLALTDNWYYVMLDVERLAVTWKRLIDQNELTREPPMRFALKGDYLAVLKQDYDQKVMYMLSSGSGKVLWHTNPKDPNSPQPMHSMFIDDNKVYGIGVYPGQGFYFVARECKTGTLLFRQRVVGYASKPKVTLIPRRFGKHAVVKVQDRQRFELKVFDLRKGTPLYTLRRKGFGPFGVHGRVSATVQNGKVVLLNKDKLSM